MCHDRDAEGGVSKSSRWSGETVAPERRVWFQEALDCDDGDEVEYLKSENLHWASNSWWYRGGYKVGP